MDRLNTVFALRPSVAPILLSRHHQAKVAAALGPRCDPLLRDALGTLPEPALTRLVSAPALYRALFSETLAPLRAWIDAERGAATTPTWTALGDVQVLGDQVLARSLQFDGMVLDLTTPFAHCTLPIAGFRPDVVLTTRPVSPDELAILTARLAEAVDRIERTSGPASALIRSGIQVLTAETYRETPQRGTLASCRAHVGMVRLLDAHRMTVAQLADGLLHEAVHQYLYRLEWDHPITGELPFADVTATSPWTGNPLGLPSFLHACAVWWTLAVFWSSPRAADWFGDEAAVLHDRAAAGFASSPWDALEVHRSRFGPELLALVLELVTHGAVP